MALRMDLIRDRLLIRVEDSGIASSHPFTIKIEDTCGFEQVLGLAAAAAVGVFCHGFLHTHTQLS